MLVGSIDTMCNTSEDVRTRNAEINGKRNISRFSTQPPHDGKVCIVGGGPSLVDCLDEIKARQANGCQVWATNNTYRFLRSHGITPDAHVLLDARPENLAFLNPSIDTDSTYYLHINCDPALFDRLDGCKVVMYDLNSAATGTTVGMKALYLAGFSGFAEFYLYGFDSSYRDDAHHAYPQTLNDDQKIIEVMVEGRTFRCSPWMVVQAEEFQSIALSFAEQGKIIHVGGDGLLPYIAQRLVHQPKVLTAVWDLAVCPTSYDFGPFLGEVEKRRLEVGAEFIDLIIQPGPVGGFRNDDLPPNVGAREGMLYRVIVGMARLMPSIRNIEILKARRVVTGDDIFPVGYTVDQPTSHYGHDYFRLAYTVLRATVAARLFVQKQRTRPYVTITLREATHWPSRNSNRPEWERVAKWIEARGYEVVWVPDAESHDANLFSWDIDMRVALYEGAVVNLGINNGPMCTIPYTSAQYILFKLVTDDVPWTTREFHARWGTKEGDHHTGRGRLIFEPDNYDIIIPELERFFQNTQPLAIATQRQENAA